MYLSDGSARAFLYSGGVVTDLNSMISTDSGWLLKTADDINDMGQIVGTGRLNGSNRMFLLTPIPEPTTILLLAICFGARARRKK